MVLFLYLGTVIDFHGFGLEIVHWSVEFADHECWVFQQPVQQPSVCWVNCLLRPLSVLIPQMVALRIVVIPIAVFRLACLLS